MNKTMRFDISHYDILLEDKVSMILECYIVHEGTNRKGTSFSLESIYNAIPSLANKPLIVMWDYGKKDFTDHGTNLNRDQLTFIGNIPESNAAEIVEYDGKQFLKCMCIVWKMYHPNVVKRFSANQHAKISMEIDANQYYTDDDGIIHIDDFVFTGICLLGDDSKYREGIKGASVDVVKFTNDNIDDMIQFYNQQYVHITDTYAVPDKVLGVLSEQIKLPQKNYSILQFCKYIIDKKNIDYAMVTDWYSKLINTRKNENFEYYGGDVAREYCQQIITKYDSEAPLIHNMNIKEQEEYSMDYGDKIELISKMLAEYAKDDNGYPMYRYFGCRDEYVVAYKVGKDSYSFVKIPYAMSDDVPKLDFGSESEVYPVMDYLELGAGEEEKEKYTLNFSEPLNELYTKLLETSQKYDATVQELSDKSEMISALETEKAELLQYKDEHIKYDKDKKAQELYTKYSAFLVDDDIKELNQVLYAEEDFDVFKRYVLSKVTPVMEAKLIEVLDKAEQGVPATAPTKEGDVQTTIVTNFSQLPLTATKATGGNVEERLRAYLNL